MPNTIASVYAAQKLIRSQHYDTVDGFFIFKQNRQYWYYTQRRNNLELVMVYSKNLAQREQ